MYSSEMIRVCWKTYPCHIHVYSFFSIRNPTYFSRENEVVRVLQGFRAFICLIGAVKYRVHAETQHDTQDVSSSPWWITARIMAPQQSQLRLESCPLGWPQANFLILWFAVVDCVPHSLLGKLCQYSVFYRKCLWSVPLFPLFYLTSASTGKILSCFQLNND